MNYKEALEEAMRRGLVKNEGGKVVKLSPQERAVVDRWHALPESMSEPQKRNAIADDLQTDNGYVANALWRARKRGYDAIPVSKPGAEKSTSVALLEALQDPKNAGKSNTHLARVIGSTPGSVAVLKNRLRKEGHDIPSLPSGIRDYGLPVALGGLGVGAAALGGGQGDADAGIFTHVPVRGTHVAVFKNPTAGDFAKMARDAAPRRASSFGVDGADKRWIEGPDGAQYAFDASVANHDDIQDAFRGAGVFPEGYSGRRGYSAKDSAPTWYSAAALGGLGLGAAALGAATLGGGQGDAGAEDLPPTLSDLYVASNTPRQQPTHEELAAALLTPTRGVARGGHTASTPVDRYSYDDIGQNLPQSVNDKIENDLRIGGPTHDGGRGFWTQAGDTVAGLPFAARDTFANAFRGARDLGSFVAANGVDPQDPRRAFPDRMSNFYNPADSLFDLAAPVTDDVPAAAVSVGRSLLSTPSGDTGGVSDLQGAKRTTPLWRTGARPRHGHSGVSEPFDRSQVGANLASPHMSDDEMRAAAAARHSYSFQTPPQPGPTANVPDLYDPSTGDTRYWGHQTIAPELGALAGSMLGGKAGRSIFRAHSGVGHVVGSALGGAAGGGGGALGAYPTGADPDFVLQSTVQGGLAGLGRGAAVEGFHQLRNHDAFTGASAPYGGVYARTARVPGGREIPEAGHPGYFNSSEIPDTYGPDYYRGADYVGDAFKPARPDALPTWAQQQINRDIADARARGVPYDGPFIATSTQGPPNDLRQYPRSFVKIQPTKDPFAPEYTSASGEPRLPSHGAVGPQDLISDKAKKAAATRAQNLADALARRAQMDVTHSPPVAPPWVTPDSGSMKSWSATPKGEPSDAQLKAALARYLLQGSKF